jgi:hypothetical protein
MVPNEFVLFNGSEQNSKCFFSSAKWFGRNSNVLSVFLFYEMFWNGILSIFICRGMVRNEITNLWVFFSFMKWFGTEFWAFLSPAEWFGTKLQSSECFSLLWNGSERNSEDFIVREMVRNEITKSRVFFSSTKWSAESESLALFAPRKQTEFRRIESKFLPVSCFTE